VREREKKQHRLTQKIDDHCFQREMGRKEDDENGDSRRELE
jgi:hypothetical protein